MSMSDPIADMMTRIRNAQVAKHEIVEIPYSRLKGEIANVMKREGFLRDFSIQDGDRKILRAFLKYTGDKESIIQGIRRDSKPGNRRYVGAHEIPRVLGGLGIAILTTSKGVVTDREARKQGIGGEVLCSIW